MNDTCNCECKCKNQVETELLNVCFHCFRDHIDKPCRCKHCSCLAQVESFVLNVCYDCHENHYNFGTGYIRESN